jgi:nucleoside-diphosphate-sugar epimerase
MRVFVTGASGHIGSAVTPKLQQAGHTVVGLARSEASAAALEAAGAEVVRGTLDDLDLLTASAAASDGVIHLGMKHDLMATGDMEGMLAADRAAIEALAQGLEGSGKPFVGTTGTLMLVLLGVSGREGTEEDHGPGGHRVESENAVIALADRDIRSSVLRLPPIVHSDLDKNGFTRVLIGCARQNGFAAYIGDGANRWPSVHTLDAADAYVLALENAKPGTRLHPVAESGIPFKDIAGAIGDHLGLPAQGVTPEEAPQRLSFLAAFAGFDNPTSSTLTREWLGWEPTNVGLLEDIAAGHYFD